MLRKKYKPRITKHDIKIGGRIRRQRKEMGLTQDRLSEMVKISPQHLCYIENGKRRPSLLLVKRLAKTMRLSLGELLAS